MYLQDDLSLASTTEWSPRINILFIINRNKAYREISVQTIAVDYESLVHALAVYVRCFTLKECGLSPDDSLRAIFLIVRSSVSLPKYSTPQCDRDLLIGLCL